MLPACDDDTLQRTVGRKSVKSCVVHYYNHFKCSESYKVRRQQAGGSSLGLRMRR